MREKSTPVQVLNAKNSMRHTAPYCKSNPYSKAMDSSDLTLRWRLSEVKVKNVKKEYDKTQGLSSLPVAAYVKST